MGCNFAKNRISEENLIDTEHRVLSLIGLPPQMIVQKDVPVADPNSGGNDVYMHTICVGDPSLPPLVMVHGYGGSGAQFFKVMKKLASKFYVIAIDLIGFGASSRPDDYDHVNISREESIDYFVEYIERWRQAMSLDLFYLAGHSFGGYIVGLYASKYPQHIKKLLLLSPIGVRKMNPETYDSEAEVQRFAEKTGRPLMLVKAFRWFFNARFTLLDLGRWADAFSDRTVIGSFAQYGFQLQKEEKEAMADNMYQTFLAKPTTEYALMVFFESTFLPYLSLSDPERLGRPDFPVPISFIYGANDWVLQVEEEAPFDLVRMNKFESSRVSIVPDSNHVMHMDNPESFANCLINDVFGSSLPVLRLKSWESRSNESIEGDLTDCTSCGDSNQSPPKLKEGEASAQADPII